MFSNIWNHPKTSVAGVLLCVVTVGGVLSQQGISLGKAGTGTVVALVCAIGTALMGLLSKDPGAGQTVNGPTPGSTAKLGALMLCALTLMGTLPTIGCTAAQKTNVAQQIVNWTPTVESAVNTITATAALLDPAAAPVFATATVGFDMLASGFVSAAKAYLANPNQTNLQLLQTLIVQFQQNVNTGLLQTAGIKNADSQKTALAAINGLATALNAVLALIQGISTPAQVKAMSAQVHVTLATVRPLMDENALRTAGAQYHVTPDQFFAYEASAGF
jgi:hypothetical protein